MRTVLIIDDEIDFYLLIKDYLGQRDYQVFAAHSLGRRHENAGGKAIRCITS